MENPNDAVTTEVNMTPLIDVSLVLVVMLLLMTPLAIESSLSVQREPASTATEQQDDVERVELFILDEVQVRVNRDVVSLGALEATIRPLLLGDTPSTVVVQCEGSVTHGTFVKVIETAKAAGAGEIALVGR